MGTRFFFLTICFSFLIATPVFATESSLLARVTVYWKSEGQLRACSNGARLRTGHCAVDPKRIPFGSRVEFSDAICTAVDSGPAVISRQAARLTGRTAAQKAALVIDRFFESKEAAMEWERAHPHFMTVRVVPPGSGSRTREAVASVGNTNEVSANGDLKPVSKQKVPTASLPKFDSTKLRLGLPLNSVLEPNHRRT